MVWGESVDTICLQPTFIKSSNFQHSSDVWRKQIIQEEAATQHPSEFAFLTALAQQEGTEKYQVMGFQQQLSLVSIYATDNYWQLCKNIEATWGKSKKRRFRFPH